MARFSILLLLHTFTAAKKNDVISTDLLESAEKKATHSKVESYSELLNEIVDDFDSTSQTNRDHDGRFDDNVVTSNDLTVKTGLSEDCRVVMISSYPERSLSDPKIRSVFTDPEWYCETKRHHLFKIDGLGSDILNEDTLISGTTHIVSNNATEIVRSKSESDEIILDANSIEVRKNKDDEIERELAQTTMGIKTLLVIRVKSLDGEPTLSAAEMSRHVLKKNIGSFASQVDGCSAGKLKFIPASGKDIVDGVMEVFVNHNLRGVESTKADQLVMEAAEKQHGFWNDWPYDFVMGVLQQNVKYFTAWAYTPGRWSLYSDYYFQKPDVLFHELGHNMGLGHSQEDLQDYGDSTGLMGGTVGIHRCFNGLKSWFLNWYSDRHALINLSQVEMWSGKMVGVNDYNNGKTTVNHTVVAKVSTGKADGDLYLILNQKEGINKGTAEYGNRVTVTVPTKAATLASDTHVSQYESQLVAALGYGSAIEYDGIVIRVCSIETDGGEPDHANVMIYEKDKRDSLDDHCNKSCGGCINEPVKICSDEGYGCQRKFIEREVCVDRLDDCIVHISNWENSGYNLCTWKTHISYAKGNCAKSCKYC